MKNKKVLSILLCTAFTVSMLAGCGSSQTAESTKTEEPASEAAVEEAQPEAVETVVAEAEAPKELEHMEISVGYWMNDTDFDGDAILDIIEEKFNVDFVPMAFTWDDYVTKTELWASTDSLPDVFAADQRNSANFATWVEEGIIREVPDLSAYLNLQKYNDVATTQECMYQGKQYAIYRATYNSEDDMVRDRYIVYRWDLAQAAGIEKEPTTWDEYREMILAIEAADPEGKNIGGMTSQEVSTMLDPFLCYNVPRACYDHWVDNNGTYVPAYFAGENLGDDMLAVLQLARDMYTEGTIDQDLALTTVDSAKNKFVNGQSAALIGTEATIFGDVSSSVYGMWQEMYGTPMEDSVKVLNLLPSANGDTYYWEWTMGWSETMFSGHVDDEKMDRIMMIYDYFASEEGNLLINYGFEGEDYVIEDGLIVELSDEWVGNKYPCLNCFGAIFAWIPYLPDTYTVPVSRAAWLMDDFLDDYKAQAAACDMPEYSIDAKQAYLSLGSKLKFNKSDDFLLVMMGTEPVEDMWNDIMKGYKADGLEEVIEQVNAAVK